MEFPRKEAPVLDADEIIFQITDWFIPEADKSRGKPDYEEEAEMYNMIVFGTTDIGSTVSVRIEGYEPYFYLRPPVEWEGYSDVYFAAQVSSLKVSMMNDSYSCVYNRDGVNTRYNKKIIPDRLETHLVDVKAIKKKEFWGFTNNVDFRFIKVTVKSLALFNGLKYYFQTLKKKGFQLYESNIDPFLRYIHEKDIRPCGWIKVTNFEEEENSMFDTRCDYNLQACYDSIVPVTRNSIAPLMIASFDIECTSSHGDFPVAMKDYRKVAQDLGNVAKAGYEITEEFILDWLETIFTEDVVIEDNLRIHRVYPKYEYDHQKHKEKIASVAQKIISILEEIVRTDDAASDDENIVAHKPVTVKEQNVLEAKINDLLIAILPPLKGDKIIQIGTTVHRYGSDDIIYKNIISLNTCDNIEGTDVISCKTEKQLLIEWKNLISNLNPDILIGYNIFGFDMEYMWMRAKENEIIDKFSTGLGRNLLRKCTLVRQELSSSALGENILKYFDMDGVVVIDLFKVMQREHKLDSYKLDTVAQTFLGDCKDDLKPHEIFKKFKGSSADRCVIAKYCIQDCALVNRLLHKLKILENNVGMGNVCLVPLNYLFKRGQGIKIFSLIAKECMKKGHLIPVIRSFDKDNDMDTDGYEGAVVLEPKEGIYLNDPIVVFDYGSLYPSSMIARNLSHDCYVMDAKYKVVDPNVEYQTVKYDLYEGVGDKKRQVGVKECVFAQYKDGRKGIIADILSMLLQERKNTRKKMEYKTVVLQDKSISGLVTDKNESEYEICNIDTKNKHIVAKADVISLSDTYNKFEQDVFDALQLAYKITANSLYGQIGARTSPIYLKDIAACTTATGREMIMLAKDFVEKEYNAEVIYGDSVMPYTPITYKTGEQIIVSTFETIDHNGFWTAYKNFKPNDNDRYCKEQYQPNNVYVWTHKGWAKIVRIIRHKTVKKIFRVVTDSGIVDVTEDHSLLDSNANIIKPVDCNIGQELLHLQPDLPYFNNNNTSEYQAYVYGQFMASGKCNVYTTDYDTHYVWEIQNKCFDVLKKCKVYLEMIEYHKFTIIYRNNVYVLTPNRDQDICNFVQKYITNCYHHKTKIVPNAILNSSLPIMARFKKGLDDTYSMKDGVTKYTFDICNQVTVQSYVVLLQMLGYKIKLVCNMATILVYSNDDNIDTRIKDIRVLCEKYDGYVYDIETEAGVFHGGIGNMILKNTDSIFCKFPLKDSQGNVVQGKQALQYAIDIGKHVEKNIVSIMPSPQKLNYEKSLYPFIIFSKKKYVGNLYENDVNKFKQKSMGIVLKRRDNAPIVKKIFGGIIDILLNKQDLMESIEFLRSELSDLVQGKESINDLVISKSLRASYKDASKISHKVLADRIAERDPGNRPQVNDRIPFVYIKVPDAKLQGDRIENPDYIVENSLVPDYLHYITNQIMNPVLQLYALCLDELPGYDKDDDYWQKLDEQLQEKPMYKDDTRRANRLANLKLNMVKELLFDEFIYMLTEAPKPRKAAKEKKTKGTVVNDVVQARVMVSSDLCADIKIVKKKESGNIEAVAKIVQDKKTIWKYENKDCKDKSKEIMTIILDMVEKYNENIIHIKINYKQFIVDYNTSLLYYSDFVKASERDSNMIQTAIENLDVGTMKTSQLVMRMYPLISVKDRFTLLKV
jgi:DNA polymerase elongation subunit (family B)